MVRQGDIYWVELVEPLGSEPGYTRPMVVVQTDAINRSGIRTYVMCALTTNLHRAGMPGNVLLDEGEGGLSRASVVVVSQIGTIGNHQIQGLIGSLARDRVREIVAGIQIVIAPR